MGQANVVVQFEVESAEEAGTLVQGWVLHPDCRVLLSYTETAPQATTDGDGIPQPDPPPEPVVMAAEEE